MNCHDIEAFFGGLALMAFAIYFFDPVGMGYKRGQIDALNGKVCYELVTNRDQTKSWKEIEPCADHQN